MQVKGNLQLMKEINTAMIMNLLHREGKITRAELTKMTKLSATTVSVLIEELIAKNFVEEIGEKITPGAGRRAISLQINKDGGYVIGISLGNNSLICAVMNLHGECVTEYKTKIAIGNDSLAERINSALKACMDQVENLNVDLILGIGISTPGIIDEQEETVLYSSLLKLNNFNLRKQIGAFFPNIPIKIVNDSNAAAFAEHYFGAAKSKSSLIYLTINEGIGSGIILGSDIHSGYKGGAGEIGHIPVDLNGELCTCGQQGCVETVLTSPYVLMKCRRLAEEMKLSVPQTIEEIIARYENGEAWLDPVFDQILNVVRLMLASMINFISPEIVIVEGWLNKSEKLTDKLRAALEAFPFPFPFSGDRIQPATFGEKGALYGSATLMLQKIFSASVLK
ncbi:ROK family protein [Paenibacillus curdlanolyticus YK9]|uniref:ROK family protein n=1 Tax=Paenibacillus curdlanolyticus YK9 TaxID=717606 RepID=E0IF15_9BACL|nr:ROK family transcriptional regulator [Paenibacillus curdlanolyticus]EFM08791.1 ROK family protein [Paenibacillus curdlanolyticus YK9]